MVVIAGKRIPDGKKVFIALTYVYGIGISTGKKISIQAEVSEKKVSQLTNEEIGLIVKSSEGYVLEDKLREFVQRKKNEKVRLGTYQGLRSEKCLPIHGQSTRHNARTAKKMRKVTVKSKIFKAAKGIKKNVSTKSAKKKIIKKK